MTRMLGRFRTGLVIGVVTLSLTIAAGTAAAAPNPTPAGFCGALNMVQAWDVGAQGGMANAMSRDNANGNAGMWLAVGNSDCR